MTKLDTDQMNNAQPKDISLAAFKILDSIQAARPEHRALGSAAFFILTCQHLKLDPGEAFRAVTNLMATKHEQIDHFEAIRLYMANERVS